MSAQLNSPLVSFLTIANAMPDLVEGWNRFFVSIIFLFCSGILWRLVMYAQ